jgi:hypothetical protein
VLLSETKRKQDGKHSFYMVSVGTCLLIVHSSLVDQAMVWVGCCKMSPSRLQQQHDCYPCLKLHRTTAACSRYIHILHCAWCRWAAADVTQPAALAWTVANVTSCHVTQRAQRACAACSTFAVNNINSGVALGCNWSAQHAPYPEALLSSRTRICHCAWCRWAAARRHPTSSCWPGLRTP